MNVFKTSRIELGTIHQAFLLSKGKAASLVLLLEKFNKFLQRRFPNSLGDQTLSSLKIVSEEYRNKAVHERMFSTEEFFELREIVYRLLNSTLFWQRLSSVDRF